MISSGSISPCNNKKEKKKEKSEKKNLVNKVINVIVRNIVIIHRPTADSQQRQWNQSKSFMYLFYILPPFGTHKIYLNAMCIHSHSLSKLICTWLIVRQSMNESWNALIYTRKVISFFSAKRWKPKPKIISFYCFNWEPSDDPYAIDMLDKSSCANTRINCDENRNRKKTNDGMHEHALKPHITHMYVRLKLMNKKCVSS